MEAEGDESGWWFGQGETRETFTNSLILEASNE